MAKRLSGGDEEEELRPTQPLASQITPSVQRRAESEVPTFVGTSSMVEDVLRSPGEPLDGTTRIFMESRFGYDFGGVRVHSHSQAQAAAAEVNANAYAVGDDIVMGSGQYAPNTSRGLHLLAHELTHVIQQGQQVTGKSVVQRDVQIPGGPQSVEKKSFMDALDGTVAWALGRSLTAAELSILKPVFGITLNYNLIRICSHAACSPDGITRTIGNLIATPASGISSSTLVHEAAHVWQHQNGIRYAYITSALVAQFGAWLLTGSRNTAYDWRIYYKYRIPWMAWNAEAQASYIEDHNALPPLYVWGTGGILPVP